MEEEFDKYFMPINYKINENPIHFDDIISTENGLGEEWQLEVYLHAQKIMEINNYSNIIDIGCGSGFKLVKYLKQYNIIGIETEPCYSYLKDKYPDRKWILSGEPEKNFINFSDETDLIICSDVIEHILDPDILINFINNFNFKKLIISTPDQSFTSPSLGPPRNKAHVREWNYENFKKYLSKYFNILESFHCEIQKECQIFVLEKIKVL